MPSGSDRMTWRWAPALKLQGCKMEVEGFRVPKSDFKTIRNHNSRSSGVEALRIATNLCLESLGAVSGGLAPQSPVHLL